MGQAREMTAGERLQVFWQVVLGRRDGVVQQDRNGQRVGPLKRVGDLNPDEIAAVVQPPLPRLRLHREPFGADQGEEDVAGADLILQHFHEVLAGRDFLHIHEDAIVGELMAQAVVEPRGGPLAVRPPVRDEDLAARHAPVPSCAPMERNPNRGREARVVEQEGAGPLS